MLVTLASHEIGTPDAPPPLSLMLPRASYCAVSMKDVREHFAQYVLEVGESELWLEFEGGEAHLNT